MTIDEIITGTTTLTPSHSDGQWRYTVSTEFILHTLSEGKLQPVDAQGLALLSSQFGWSGTWRVDLHYPETEVGGSPSLATVIQDVAAQVGSAYAALRAEWVGKTATATLE